MLVWLSNLGTRIAGSYWFVPSLMTSAAVILAWIMATIDGRLGELAPLMLHTGPDGARAILSTLAGSMITTAGVTFSITIASVITAAGNHGARLLTNFLNDRGNQITLGTFIATFVYCMIVLASIREHDGSPVPHLSVAMGGMLGLGSVVVLIYFLHHVPSSVHVSNVTAQVGRDLLTRLRALHPEPFEATATDPPAFPQPATPLRSSRSGFVQTIDLEGLRSMARKGGWALSLSVQPGDFVGAGQRVAFAYPEGAVGDGSWEGAFTLGSLRNDTQDVRLHIDLLVEIAARALSPGVNDPFTAMACISWLGAALRVIGERQTPSRDITSDEGRLLVRTLRLGFEDYCEAAIGQLTPYVAPDRNAAIRVLDVGEDLIEGLPKERVAVVRAHLDRLVADVMATAAPGAMDVVRHYRRTGIPHLLEGSDDLLSPTARAQVHGP